MVSLDFFVIAVYGVGLLIIGFVFSRKVQDSADMFLAGGQSPWWVSGLSGFMTMFSAGTFVVWGGIAYRWGLVGVTINLCTGIGVFLAGYFVARRWRVLGVSTPAEYFRLRFGKSAMLFYTVFNLLYKLTATAVALYAIAVILSSLMPLPQGSPFRDPQSGMLSVGWAVVFCGATIVIYTVAGGLWAVLMTDVLQFLVLNLTVLFVIPLSLAKVGGVGNFVSQAPEGFFKLTGGDFTFFFLLGWVMIQFASVGGEWAFAQRHMCVPKPNDARKATFLFGAMYLISPFLWLLPPMIYRIQNPGVDQEQAYILACQSVLPAGMIGLMFAAMYSATASMVSSQLNVFAGVLANDFYRPLVGAPSGRHLVAAGRIATVILGAIIIATAIAVPAIGGATSMVLGVAAIMIPPLMLPTIWGLFSRRVGASAVWLSVLITFGVSGLLKVGFAPGGWFERGGFAPGAAMFIQSHFRAVETLVAVVTPMLVLSLLELAQSRTSTGWTLLGEKIERETRKVAPRVSTMPARIIGLSFVVLGVLMAVLTFFNPQDRMIMIAFALANLAISAGIFLAIYVLKRRSTIEVVS